MQNNKHISEFLQYYYELEKPPEYAVLLTGLWGSGKTWFVENFIKQVDGKPKEILYISLYGVKSFKDIDAEFFRLLHPVLSSKQMQLLGRFTKGMLKATINFDINGDSKPDVSATGGLPDVLFEQVDLSVSRMLVFDDLERCSIPIHDLMGYINQLVEHGKFKAILIANEKEIHPQEPNDNSPRSSYRCIKEKLIGRTFEVIPELTPALECFINDLPSDSIRALVKENESIVTQVYESSKFKNLRLLRHSLWEFDRLAKNLEPEIQKNKPLLTELLSIFLAYSFEVRSGSITPSEITKVQMSIFESVMADRRQTNPDEKFNEIRLKYSFINFYEQLLPNDIWEKVFSTGSIPSAELNESLLNSKYFNTTARQNWVRLWHGINLSDEEFDLVLHSVEEEWNSDTYERLEVVLHVFGIFLRFSKFGIYKKAPDRILIEAKERVDRLIDKKIIAPTTIEEAAYPNNYDYNMEAYAGLGYLSKDAEEFKDLLKYIRNKKTELLQASFPDRAKELLELMKRDSRLFMSKLILNNHKDNEYYEIPILIHIDPDLFIENLMSLNHEDRYNVAYIFEVRYQFDRINPKLIDEIPWLKKVVNLLQSEIDRRVGKISWVSLNEVIMPFFSDAITTLERFNRSTVETLEIASD